MRAIFSAGGVAYAACRGDCDQPCFYRFVAEKREDDFVTAYLNDHMVQTSEGMQTRPGKRTLEPVPVHLDLGEAYWSAMRAVEVANGKWLSWRGFLLDRLGERLAAEHPAVCSNTARVVVNDRDYWFTAKRNRYSGEGFQWEPLLSPEDQRVELTITGNP
jgi:hypothetical protein